MPNVKAVCISDAKGQPKKPVERAELKANFGIVGDAHADSATHRQVSLLDESSVNLMRQEGRKLSDGDFGENVLTADLPLEELGIGTILQIGPTAQLQISQIGKACYAPCAIGRHIGQCIMPTQGLFTRVLEPGAVTAGDDIRIVRRIERTTVQAAVITVSDRCSAGKTEDRSGPLLAEMLREALHCNIAAQCIMPDEHDIIAEQLTQFSEPERFIDLVFTTGGTGFAPRDVTPEATHAVIDRPTPGIAEAIRQAGIAVTPAAMLSRATAGIRNRTLIVNLPGSVKAIAESLPVIIPALGHAVQLLRGQVADCGRQTPDQNDSNT